LTIVFLLPQECVRIEFDPAKSARNARERGLPFELTAELEWSAARVRRDERRDCA